MDFYCTEIRDKIQHSLYEFEMIKFLNKKIKTLILKF